MTQIPEAQYPNSKRFGAMIRMHRKRVQMTQDELAFAVGVDRRVIGRLERGIGTVRLETALRAAHALGLEFELPPRS